MKNNFMLFTILYLHGPCQGCSSLNFMPSFGEIVTETFAIDDREHHAGGDMSRQHGRSNDACDQSYVTPAGENAYRLCEFKGIQ